MGISNLTGKPLKTSNRLQITDYLLQSACAISFADFNILAMDSNKFMLLQRKSLLKKRDNKKDNKVFSIEYLFDKNDSLISNIT